MGFSDFWVLYDAESAEVRRSISKHIHCKTLSKSNPWLVLDVSNVTFQVCQLSGGSFRVFQRYCEAFWRAVFFSNFRILLISDGSHNCERGVIKLVRMMKSVRLLGEREEDLDDSALFYSAESIRDRVMREAIATLGPDLVIERITATEEADGRIRSFCKSVPNEVLVLSNDTSLILDLDENKFIVSMSRLVLSFKEGCSFPLLFGPALKVGELCTKWAKLCYKTLFDLGIRGPIIEELKLPLSAKSGAAKVSPLNPKTLVFVSALLESELADIDPLEADNSPSAFLSFLKNYCFPYDHPLRSSNDRYDKRKLDFLVAILAVLIYSRYQQSRNASLDHRSFAGFENVLEETKKVAEAVMNRQPEGQSLFELTRRNSGSFPKICQSTLSIDVSKVMIVLNKRLAALLDQNTEATSSDAASHPLYRASWGTWMSSEPNAPGFDTHAILHPFVSLMEQISFAGNLSPTPVDPINSSGSVSADDLNNWLLSSTAFSPAAERCLAHRIWTTNICFGRKEGFDLYSKRQLFLYVRENGRLPEKGILTWEEVANDGNQISSPTQQAVGVAVEDTAAGAEIASTSSVVATITPPPSGTIYRPPVPPPKSTFARPSIAWEFIDDNMLFTISGHSDNVPPCDNKLAVWSASESDSAILNLNKRAILLNTILIGSIEKRIAVDAADESRRIQHPFIETLLELGGERLQKAAKCLSKVWKKTCASCFKDDIQLRISSLGAAHVLIGFADTFGRLSSYPWAAQSRDVIHGVLVDGLLLSPLFAKSSEHCSILDGVEKNLRAFHRRLFATLPERSRNLSRSSFRWVEILYSLVYETLSASSDDNFSCEDDLMSWFEPIGIALVLHSGFKAEAYFPPNQCAALWCDELREFLGVGDLELESFVASISEARAAILKIVF